MNILDKIIVHKRSEVAQLKQEVALKRLVESPAFKRTPISLKESLRDSNGTGIIAEFKRQSPSKGVINDIGKFIRFKGSRGRPDLYAPYK